MKRISISVRIAICLALLSLCGVLLARVAGIFPDTRSLKLQGRVALCESVAINCSLLAHQEDFRGITRNLNAFVLRNDDVLSAALRQAGGSLVVQVGNHQTHWQGNSDGHSTTENIYVPITSGNAPWGNVEVAFKPLRGAGLGKWLSPFVEFAIFLTAFNSLLFIFWLRRVLTHLDPSRVMPQRVRSALDTLAEGLLVLDNRGRIMMANKAFSETVAERSEDLQGRLATELDWGELEDKAEIPWSETLGDGEPRAGVPMKLKARDKDVAFIVNAAPILGEDGKSRGVLASFDDVTELDTKKSELLKILRALKTSREEIQEQNVQLKRLATMDPLTECLNRRSFFPQFDAEWQKAKADGLPLCGFMVDVDHFKSINDDHGHGKGDEVLKGVAACLREQVGDDGLVCRFGGEEFCALLPGFTLEQAVERAERVRIALSECDFEIVKITASLGVSSIDLGANDPQGLLEQADKCLYVAKRSGRNQVVPYRRDMETLEVDESKIRRTKDAAEEPVAEAQIPFAAVASLTSALAYRHAETAEHCSRVADLCVAAARGVLSVSESYVLEIAALLHDIGKIGVPDAILLKPGKLTDEEWRVMKNNERIGAEIVGSAFDHKGLVDIIRYHTAPYSQQAGVTHMPHGDQLPTGARILAIADAYDAMLTQKNYRAALTQQDAFAELSRCSGVQFDPQLVARFIEAVQSNPDLSRRTQQIVSRQAAIRVSKQIEELAKALDEQDLTAIEALSGRLQATAANSGAANVEQLAARIHESVASSDDAAELFELTMELTDLCRAAQRRNSRPVNSPSDSPKSRRARDGPTSSPGTNARAHEMPTTCHGLRSSALTLGLALLLGNALYAEDWPKIIQQLERRTSSREGKQQLAVAYNNHAMELAKDGKFSEAESQLKKALQYDSKNKRLQSNLSAVLFNHAVDLLGNRRNSSRGSAFTAKSLAQQALRYDARAAEPYMLIGDIEYNSQQLQRAKNAWEKAKRLNPSLPGLDDRLQKLQSEFAVEKQFNRVGSYHFDLRFQDQIDRSTAFDLRGVLDQARQDVGRDFNYWPRRPIVVLIYSEEGFAKVRRGPDWAAGIYDGKIRVPFPSNAAAKQTVQPTLYHEYTHAIIHDITHNKCPVWLNEGIAEYQEARLRKPYLAHLRAAQRQDRLLPLASLDAAFKSRDANVAGLAYQQSYSLVTFLVQKYRFYRIRKVLEAIGNDKTADEAFQDELRISLAQLETRWIRWLPGFVRAQPAG